MDDFPVSLFGDYHETLLWLDGDGRAVARQVGEVVEAAVATIPRDIAGAVLSNPQ